MSDLPIWLGAVLSALTVISILAFSDRFSRYGLSGWKTALFGMLLVFLAFVARALISLENLAQLFLPGIPEFVSQLSEIVVAVGAVTTALSVFVSVRKLAADREMEKQKESELQFLDNLKSIIFEPFSLVEVLNFSLNEISRTLNDCRGAIFIHNPSRKELYLTSSVGLDRPLEAVLEKISLDGDIVSRSQKVSRSHAIGRLSHSDKATQALLAGMGVESAIAAPLMSRNGSVGVILILGENPYQFARRESEILNSAANLLGPVVASFRMEREIRQLNERISITVDRSRRQLDILSALDSSSSPSHQLGVLLEHGQDILRGDGAVLASRSDDGSWMILKSTDESPFEGTVPENLAKHFDKTIQDGKPIAIRTTLSDGAQRARFLVFPIALGGARPSTLVASVPSERESFSPDEISRMQLVLKLIELVLPQLHSHTDRSELAHDDFVELIRPLLLSETRRELGDKLAEAVYGFMPEYDAGMVLTLESDGEFMRVFASFGYDGREVDRFKLRAERGPWGTAYRLGKGSAHSERREIEELFLSLAGDELTWFMERSSTRKLPSFCTTVPLNWNDQRTGVLFLEGSDDSLEQFDKSPERELFFDLLAFKLRSFAEGTGSRGVPTGGGAIGDLNQVNNVLTGIIGKAQLLGFGLKDEELPDKESVLLNLDLIVDEAFQAGELIKQLQREIRREDTTEGESSAVDLSQLLKRLTIVRYGSDPNLHYLRDNPDVIFEADLSLASPVHGKAEDIEPLVNEVLEWVWDEFDVDEHILVNLQVREGYSYVIVSDHVLSDEEKDIGNFAFKPLALHPDLSQSEAVGSVLQRSVSFYERNLRDGERLFCMRFDREDVGTDQSSQSLSILAIDDQEIIRELLSGMLDQLGYEVTVCSTGRQGVEAFQKGRYDLVITDISLPDIDGWEVVERIKDRDPDIPIIMISGWGLDEEVEKAGRYGVDHILPKPFRLENLSELIEKVKSRRATA